MITDLYPALLIISNNQKIRHKIKARLQEKFFVVTAKSAFSALQTIKSTFLKFIVLDDSLSDCDPLELALEIKTSPCSEPVPLLIITGNLGKEYRSQMKRAGAAAFIDKYHFEEELLEQIEHETQFQSTQKKTAPLFGLISKEEFSKIDLKEHLILPAPILAMMQKNPFAALLIKVLNFKTIKKEIGNTDSEAMMLALYKHITKKLNKNNILIPYKEGRMLLILTNSSGQKAIKASKELVRHINLLRFQSREGGVEIRAAISLSHYFERHPLPNKAEWPKIQEIFCYETKIC